MRIQEGDEFEDADGHVLVVIAISRGGVVLQDVEEPTRCEVLSSGEFRAAVEAEELIPLEEEEETT